MTANFDRITRALTALSLLLMAGCAAQPAEDDFGESVRHMIEVQTYPVPNGTAARPSTLDGGMAEEAIRVYREGPKSSAPSPMMIELTGGAVK